MEDQDAGPMEDRRDSRRDNRRDGGQRDRFDRGPREMHKATCSECGKECEVPFKPSDGISAWTSWHKRRSPCKEGLYIAGTVSPREGDISS